MYRAQSFLIALIACCAALLALPQAAMAYYPEVVVEAAADVRLTYLQHSLPSEGDCARQVLAVSQAVLDSCPACRIVRQQCRPGLSARQKLLLSEEFADVHVVRLPRGVLAFEAADRSLARASCEATEQAVKALGGTCVAPVSRDKAVPLGSLSALQFGATPPLQTLSALALFGALVSAAFCWLLVASQRWHGRFTHDHANSGPQKFHEQAVPRIGGIALALALGLEVIALHSLALIGDDAITGFGLLGLSALPAFAGGIAEDLTKKVGPLARLLLTMAAGALAAALLHASLDRLDVPWLDALLHYWPLLAIAFTAFAVAGVANSVNLIDGYNGLAAAFAVVALIAFAVVSAQIGDQIVLIASLSMLGAVTGFLVWNWPVGRIFMGDGGAYLLGFWLAELGVLLVVRNPSVSPWFPLLLMVYPVWETLFSVYRRAWHTRQSPGQPDAQHLHHLVYEALLRRVPNADAAGRARCHRTTMPRLLILIVPFAAMAVWLNEHTVALMVCTGLFAVVYGALYRRLERLSLAPSQTPPSTPARSGS